MPSLNEHYSVNEGMSEGKNLEHHKRNGEPTRGKGEVLKKPSYPNRTTIVDICKRGMNPKEGNKGTIETINH